MVETIRKFIKRSGAIASSVAFIAVLSASALASSLQPAQASAATSCDKVNIIYCGISGIDNFQNIYDSNHSGHVSSPTIQKDYTDLHTVYGAQGITASLVNSMDSSNTKSGTVLRDGRVVVDGRTVGTNAKISARFSVSGAQHIAGTNAYIRDVSSSFKEASRPALVRFSSNGTMLFAIVKPCGNGVTAVPVAQAPKPQAPKPAQPQQPKPQQSLVCDRLTFATTGQKNQYRFTARANTTNGATISSYDFDFGDGQRESGQNNETSTSITHTYAAPGTYRATVTVNGTANNAAVSDTRADCAVSVTVAAPTVTPPTPAPTAPTPVAPTPTPPTQLPNAGAGSVLGIFGITAITSALGHHFFLKRRFNS